MTEEKLSAIAEKWEFFNTPPFTSLKIDGIRGAFNSREWLIQAFLPDALKEKKEKEYWANICNEIIESLSTPSKVLLLLDRESTSSAESKDYDDWFGINLTATKINNDLNFDFSGDDLSHDPRLW